MADLTLEALIQQIQSDEDTVRAGARDNASSVGAQAILPLAKLAASGEREIQRSSIQAMQNIVDYAGRPGAEEEAGAVSAELLKLLDDPQPIQLRRDVLWMIWQIAGDEAVEPVAALLTHAKLRDGARMTLERLPGAKATAALQTALATANDSDKPAIAHSLRQRGIATPGLPDLRLVPTKREE